MKLDADQYVPQDVVSETADAFSLREAIDRKNSLVQSKGQLFSAVSFFVTPRVYPQIDTLKEIVDSAGGKVVRHRLPNAEEMKMVCEIIDLIWFRWEEKHLGTKHLAPPGGATNKRLDCKGSHWWRRLEMPCVLSLDCLGSCWWRRLEVPCVLSSACSWSSTFPFLCSMGAVDFSIRLSPQLRITETLLRSSERDIVSHFMKCCCVESAE